MGSIKEYKGVTNMSTLREWIERILILITIVVLIVLVYAINYYKENRINNIEKTIQNHTHYIDKLVSDVDNLKEQEMLDRGKIKRPH